MGKYVRRKKSPLKAYRVYLKNGTSHLTTGRSKEEVARRYGGKIVRRIVFVKYVY